ncbi:hypothetical protein Holit_00644 [Hollandina sp. SP2]
MEMMVEERLVRKPRSPSNRGLAGFSLRNCRISQFRGNPGIDVAMPSKGYPGGPVDAEQGIRDRRYAGKDGFALEKSESFQRQRIMGTEMDNPPRAGFPVIPLY